MYLMYLITVLHTLTYTLVAKLGSLVSIIHKLCHTVYTCGIVYSKWKCIVVMSKSQIDHTYIEELQEYDDDAKHIVSGPNWVVRLQV